MTFELALDNVSAGYDPKRMILHEVTLRFTAGEFVALVGPNGSGKTTTLRVLSRVLKPQVGCARMNNEDIFHLSSRDIARRISFAPQEEPPVFPFTVREIVMMGRHPYQLGWTDSSDDVSAVNAMLSLTGLDSIADKPITSLSGGERQRATIARAMAQSGDFLLLDEPLAHLDIAHQVSVLRLMKQVSSGGKGVICALHDLNLAAEYADRIVVMSKGKALADGAPSDVLQPDILQKAYGAPVMVRLNPLTGKPAVFTLPVAASPVIDPNAPCIHIICGGGSGAPLFLALLERGFRVTSGVTNVLDTDEETARALGLEQAVVSPFSPIDENAEEAVKTLMNSADSIVVSDVPFGDGNVKNLEIATAFAENGKSVAIIGSQLYNERDFCGGKAEALFNRLMQLGAKRFETQTEYLKSIDEGIKL